MDVLSINTQISIYQTSTLNFVKFNQEFVFKLYSSSYWPNDVVWASMDFFTFLSLSEGPGYQNVIMTNQIPADQTMLQTTYTLRTKDYS